MNRSSKILTSKQEIKDYVGMSDYLFQISVYPFYGLGFRIRKFLDHAGPLDDLLMGQKK